MSEKIKIRRMLPEDYDAATGVWSRAGLLYRQAGRDSKESFQKQIEAQGALMLAAEKNGRIVGVAVGSHDNRKGWINRLAVEPESRKQGVASELVKALEAAFRELNLPVYSSLISGGNRESISLFKSMGYECDENIKYFSKRLGDDV